MKQRIVQYMRENFLRLGVATVLIALLALGMVDPATSAVGFMPFMLGDTTDVGAIKKLLEDQGRAWEEFKSTNDAALKASNTKSGEVLEKMAKMNADFDRIQKGLTEVETRQQRMMLEGSTINGKKVSPEEKEHQKGFIRYMRRGVDTDLYALQEKSWEAHERDLSVKTMSVGSDPDGGYYVTPNTSGQMVQKIFETSPIRAFAAVQAIGTDALEGPNDLNDGVSGGWVAEQGARPATGTPQVGKWRIPVHEMYAFPFATQSLLDDAAFDVEGWLVGKTTDKMGRDETTAFFTGTGIGKPRGLLTYPTAATADAARAWGTFEHVATGTSGGFGAAGNGSDKLVDLVHKIKAVYRAGAAFWLGKATLGETRKLKDAAGNYVWLPAASGAERSIAGVPPSTLIGYPVVEAEDMPLMGANSLSIGFGSMARTYQIVDRIGFRLVRDALTNKPFVGFYVTRRVGGDCLHFETFKFLKFI